MKKGYYYYMLLTPEERQKLKSEIYNTHNFKYLLRRYYIGLWYFIAESCEYNEYWKNIAESESQRSHRPKKKQKENTQRSDVYFTGRRIGKSLTTCSVDVAVLTPYRKNFDYWVRDHGKKGVNYIMVNKTEDVRGRKFDRYERGYLWEDIPNIDRLLHDIQNRLK